MLTDTVRFYNDQKGFGFIQPNTAENCRSGKVAVYDIQTA
jgi:hypothetical protein